MAVGEPAPGHCAGLCYNEPASILSQEKSLLAAIHRTVQEKIARTVQETFGVVMGSPVLNTPPRVELGDISTPVCFELAKRLRQPPRKIAEQLAERVLPLDGIAEARVAGAGYLNFFLDRAHTAALGYRYRTHPAAVEGVERPDQKIIVEHTSINPNKAAHIGHLRNALMGDALVRLLRDLGRTVEVQNYIDDTGVQVADVVVGFTHLENRSLDEVAELARDAAARFDYHCWDLYARVSEFYTEDESRLRLRKEALEAIEEGQDETARMGRIISDAILQKHLETMQRLDIQYDLLAQESEILRLDFWKTAFELLKKSGALTFEDSGKNEGCWVMALNDSGENSSSEESDADDAERVEDVKIIVRSNGTVTYVGKDIGYHLWKFGLLSRDFTYEHAYRYPTGHEVWKTSPGEARNVPAFGAGREVYTVIDRRQSYLQNIVAAGLRAMGYAREADNLHHVAYEIVGLSQRCAREMGIELDEEQKKRSYIEVSGRKGVGVKADDLIDRLIDEALREVKGRHTELPSAEQREIAEAIGIGALRYFLLKYTRNSLIAFDFHDALAFEGETGPYLQYSVVRARNILRKFSEANPDFRLQSLGERADRNLLFRFLNGRDGDPLWELIALSLQVEWVAEQAVNSLEPSIFSKFGFKLAQAFNNFYHRYHVLTEKDDERQLFLLFVVQLVSTSLAKVLDLLGIRVPEMM